MSCSTSSRTARSTAWRRSPEVANAVADAAKVFKAPVLGMVGTRHEKVYTPRLEFMVRILRRSRLRRDGRLIITREHDPVEPWVAARALRALKEGLAESATAEKVSVRAEQSAFTPIHQAPTSLRRR